MGVPALQSGPMNELTLDDLDYHLPSEQIAQAPAAERDASRLLHYHRATDSIHHRRFTELPDLLHPGDLLILNDSRVTPAKFTLIKSTGGRVEGLFLDEAAPGRWHVMLKNVGPIHDRLRLTLDSPDPIPVRSIEREENHFLIELDPDHSQGREPAHIILDRIGRMPLPPYIRRERGHDERDDLDHTRYQTVYAKSPGSIAAPTAGLHFTPRVFDALDRRGVRRAYVTLHVGLGTFKPIETHNLADHQMHEERYELSETTCELIRQTRQSGHRVIAVGTTTCRVLESQPPGEIRATAGSTRLFLRPPQTFRHVDALITNFHQPRSTLIALVMTAMGIDAQRRAYGEAVSQGYRFLSYGDSMFIDGTLKA